MGVMVVMLRRVDHNKFHKYLDDLIKTGTTIATYYDHSVRAIIYCSVPTGCPYPHKSCFKCARVLAINVSDKKYYVRAD